MQSSLLFRLFDSITIEPIILNILFSNFKSKKQIHKNKLRIYAKLDADNIGEVKFQNSITIIQCEIITEVQYNEIINDLKSSVNPLAWMMKIFL